MTGAARGELGRWGENLVADWYVERGFRIVARNWRRRAGEIDIVARRADLTVVCEVKTRSSNFFGAPAMAVGHQKQRRLRGLAAEFLTENPCRGLVRFDVAEVVMADRTTAGRVKVCVIEGAF